MTTSRSGSMTPISGCVADGPASALQRDRNAANAHRPLGGVRRRGPARDRRTPLTARVGLIGYGRWGANVQRDLVTLGVVVHVAEPDAARRDAAVEAGADHAVRGRRRFPSVTGTWSSRRLAHTARSVRNCSRAVRPYSSRSHPAAISPMSRRWRVSPTAACSSCTSGAITRASARSARFASCRDARDAATTRDDPNGA